MVPVAFETNLYKTALATSLTHDPVSSADLAAFLVLTLALTTVSFLAAKWLASSAFGRQRLRNVWFGWLADLVDQAQPETRFVTVFVLSKVSHENLVMGYQGLLENLNVNADKEITSISLVECNVFTLQLGEGTAQRQLVPRAEPIPRMYFERTEISNMAFSVREVEPADAPAA
jgi:hypothetical protein